MVGISRDIALFVHMFLDPKMAHHAQLPQSGVIDYSRCVQQTKLQEPFHIMDQKLWEGKETGTYACMFQHSAKSR